MPQRDSIDKVVQSYFSSVTNQSFLYKGEEYHPKLLRVSPMLFRGFTCPPMCAACCPRFSLDYLPATIEPHPTALKLKRRKIPFITGTNFFENEGEVEVYSDMQLDHDNHHCKNVNKDDGRCGIHGRHPFSCDFELIRFMHSNDDARANNLTQKLYGRSWQMKRIDGDRGTMCEMTTPSKETIAEVVRKLNRLKTWIEYFGIKKHKVDRILEWATDDGYRNEPLWVVK